MTRSWAKRWWVIFAVLTVLGVATILRVTETNLAASQTPILRAVPVARDPGLDPGASIWQQVSALEVGLTAQQVTYPVGGSGPMIRARAVHFDDTLYVRIAWNDSTVNDRSFAPEDFADAVAVEFPARAASSVPSICMGQADSGVNIWYWRADSQSGLVTDPSDARTNALVDWYPFPEEDLFFPARAAGNPLAVVSSPVQNLVAEAFGTLAPSVDQTVLGNGTHNGDEWAVVIARPFLGSTLHEAAFELGTTTDIAFAVWDGDQDERNAQKAISQFVRLEVSGGAAIGGGETPPEDEDPAVSIVGAGDKGVSWPAAIALAIAIPLTMFAMLLLFNRYADERVP